MEIAHILFALDFVPHFRFLGPFEVYTRPPAFNSPEIPLFFFNPFSTHPKPEKLAKSPTYIRPLPGVEPMMREMLCKMPNTRSIQKNIFISCLCPLEKSESQVA